MINPPELQIPDSSESYITSSVVQCLPLSLPHQRRRWHLRWLSNGGTGRKGRAHNQWHLKGERVAPLSTQERFYTFCFCCFNFSPLSCLSTFNLRSVIFSGLQGQERGVGRRIPSIYLYGKYMYNAFHGVYFMM